MTLYFKNYEFTLNLQAIDNGDVECRYTDFTNIVVNDPLGRTRLAMTAQSSK
jgi:hypothetical protein